MSIANGNNKPTNKRCSECREWKRISTDSKESEFYTAGTRRGVQQWGSRCKECDKAIKRARWQEGNHKWQHKQEYARARSRALTKLKRLVPELYEMCLKEELAKEGVPYHPRHTPYERRSVKLAKDNE